MVSDRQGGRRQGGVMEGCGASMSYDASARTLRCPFCGSEKLEEQKDAKMLRPQWVVPFAIRQDDALARQRQFRGVGQRGRRRGEWGEEKGVASPTRRPSSRDLY